MQILIHGPLTAAVAEALHRREHKVHEVSELGLPAGATAQEILQAAGRRQWDVLTADPEMARAPFDGQVRFGRSIVFLELPGGEVEQDDAVDRLFERYPRLTPRRLYSVTATRVKIRQLPGA